MNPILDQFGSDILPTQTFEFSLADCSPDDRQKIRDEIMDKERAWENSLSSFFANYEEFVNSWRVRARLPSANKPKSLSNSKSGETHRATETLATAWFSMLTANDPCFEAVKRGLAPDGNELTETDLYLTESIIRQQLRDLKFKQELYIALNSVALMGTAIIEEPWVIRKTLDGMNYLEGTGFKLRSLLQTGFDTGCTDVDDSDYLFTVDYPTIHRLRSWMKSDPETWNKSLAEEQLAQAKRDYGDKTSGSVNSNTNVYSRLIARKERAGYTPTDSGIREWINYHGRLDVENSIIGKYWESKGFQGDPSDYDFTVGILEGEVVKFHVTQFGSWRTKFKTAHYKKFEVEPLAYGVGALAKKAQRMLDVTDSRASDVLMFSLYNMWKLGKFSGVKGKDLQIKPQNVIEMEDIAQLEPLRPDVQSIMNALAMRNGWVEDLRSTTGAMSNLQAQVTKATATESAITQNEAIRSVSVHAEIIGESFLRDHITQMHVNNLNFLDEPIWVSMTGERKPMLANRQNLPYNVGFETRITTDKDYRPERLQKMLEGVQVFGSIRNDIDPLIARNFVKTTSAEIMRALGLNPRDLEAPLSVAEQMRYNLGLMQRSGRGMPGGAPPEIGAEMAGDPMGGGTNISTPVGPVPTSPLPEQFQAQVA